MTFFFARAEQWIPMLIHRYSFIANNLSFATLQRGWLKNNDVWTDTLREGLTKKTTETCEHKWQIFPMCNPHRRAHINMQHSFLNMFIISINVSNSSLRDEQLRLIIMNRPISTVQFDIWWLTVYFIRFAIIYPVIIIISQCEKFSLYNLMPDHYLPFYSLAITLTEQSLRFGLTSERCWVQLFNDFTCRKIIQSKNSTCIKLELKKKLSLGFFYSVVLTYRILSIGTHVSSISTKWCIGSEGHPRAFYVPCFITINAVTLNKEPNACECYHYTSF